LFITTCIEKHCTQPLIQWSKNLRLIIPINIMIKVLDVFQPELAVLFLFVMFNHVEVAIKINTEDQKPKIVDTINE